MSKQWFRALVPGGHVGAGRVEERVIYLYAENAGQAEQILYARTGGWKKAKGPFSVRPLASHELAVIEETVNARGNITIELAMRDGFLYADRR